MRKSSPQQAPSSMVRMSLITLALSAAFVLTESLGFLFHRPVISITGKSHPFCDRLRITAST